MENSPLKIFSPQTANIYRLLLGKKESTAKEIAEKLDILPNAVYRVVKHLLRLGFVHKTENYPVKYKAIPETEALDFYSATIRQYFQTTFPQKKTNGKKILDISFIKSREDLRESTDNDVKTAKDTLDFIVSGLEVPAETVLIYKQAIERGVKIRALVQRLDYTNERVFHTWRKIGLLVKYYPNMEARIFIFDKKIIYFTSYKPERKEEAIGLRFNYVPYAKLMSEMFEQRWKMAKEI